MKELKLSTEQQKLVTEYHYLIMVLIKRYHLELNEYYDILAISLCKAASTYDSNKSKFSTYAIYLMNNDLHMNYRNSHTKNRIPMEELVSLNSILMNQNSEDAFTLESIIPSNENLEVTYELKSTIDLVLTQSKYSKYKNIFVLYLNGYNTTEIAKEKGISQSYISRIIRNIRKEISEIYYDTQE